MVVQQKRSRLQGTVMIDNFRALKKRYTKQEDMDFSARGARSPGVTNTPVAEPTYLYRWLSTSDFDLSALWDRNDEFIIGDMQNPRGVTVNSFAAAYARREDDTLIAAMAANAVTGSDGTGSTVLPATSKVSTDVGGVGTDLNLDKIRATNKAFLDQDVDPGMPKWWVIGPSQVEQLQTINEYNSIDYNVRKGLAQGMPVPFMGFNFIVSTRLTNTPPRLTYAYCQEAMVFNPGYGLEIHYDERSDKRYDRQLYAMIKHGAMRYYDEYIVEVSCTE